ncbi:endonuclease [Buchnera aphidicola]|uniref:endonuclease n=1 Tax=Buchnera aphidicola TaxID=9 RepID=UPI003463D5B0
MFLNKKNHFYKHHVQNFYQSKLIAIKIHKNAPGSFYCGCTIIWKQKKGIPNLSSCGYKIRKNKIRATRIEWEHIVPAWQFGHQKKCWKQGGRKKCIKIDPVYKNIESDIHNLQPAIGEINGDRSNFMYGQLNDTVSQYGKCNIKIDFKKKIVEPPERSRGAIARTYFYMNKKYKIVLSHKQKKLFILWDKQFPVTKWECEREQLIFHIQGYHNNYIYKKCIKNNK